MTNPSPQGATTSEPSQPRFPSEPTNTGTTATAQGLEQLAQLAARLLQAPVSLVSLIAGDCVHLKHSTGLPEPWCSVQQIPLSASFCQHLVPGGPLVIQDARLDPRVANATVVQELGIVAYLGVPVVASDSDEVWSLCVIDVQPREWSQEEIEALQQLAQLVRTEVQLRAEIAERERVCEELRRVAERDQLQVRLLDMVGQAVIAMDLDRRILYWNRAAERLYGWLREDVLGKSASTLPLLPADAGQRASKIRARLERGEPWAGEFVVQRKDGSHIHVYSMNTPLYDAEGRVAGFIGVSTDISLQKRNETALHEQQEHLRRVLGQVPCVLWSTDKELRITLGVGAGLAPLGLQENQGIGLSLYAYYGTDDPHHPAIAPHLRALAGESVAYDTGLLGRGFHCYVEPLRAEEGEIIGTSGLALDITERKRAEAWSLALQRLGQQLNGARSPTEAARVVLNLADDLLGWDACWLEVVTPDLERGRPVVRVDTVDGKRSDVPEANAPELVSPLTRRVFREGPLLVLRTPETMPQSNEMACAYGDKSRPSASLMCVPIRSGGQPLGAISVQSYSFDAYTQEDLRLLEALADYCAGALERAQAEEALRDSEHRQRQLLETVRVIPWEADPETWRFTYVGPQAEQRLGYPLAQWYEPDFWLEHLHPEDREWVVEYCLDCTEHGDGHELEYRIVAADGNAVWVRDVVSVVFDQERLVALRGFMFDITERKRAELALQQSHALLQAVTEGTTDAVFAKDREGRYLMINTAGAQFLGKSVGEVLGRNDTELFPPDSAQQVLEGDCHVLATGENITQEEEHVTAAGVSRTYLATKGPLRDAEGRMVGTVGISRDISDRKRAETELVEANRRATTILESITDAFFAVDRESRFIYLNGEAERLLQRSRDELLGKELWDEFAEAMSPRFYAEYQRAVGENVPAHFEEYYPPLSTWFEMHAYPSSEGLAVYFRDVTQRRAAEEALRASEERFHAIFDHAVIGIAVVGPEGRPLESNRALQQMLGYTAAELRELAFTEFTHPDDAAKDWDHFQELLAGERESYQMEKRFLHKTGDLVYAQLTVSLVRDAGGAPLFAVGMAENITERRRAQEERDRLFAVSLDVLCIAGFDGYYKRINPAFEKTLGHSLDDLLARPFLEWVHPEDQAATVAEMEKLGAGQPTLYFENRFRCADGSYKWLAWTGVPIQEQGLIYAVARDMTRQKETEATLQQLQSQLVQAQKMEAVGRLAGGVAHDFNNMLAVINGYSQLLLSRGDLDAAMRSSLAEVKKAGERAADLTGQLLAFSRKSMVTLQPLDLNDVVRDVERMLGRLIGEDIQLHLDLEPDSARIRANRGQMDQVLMNLAVNARDAMPTGGHLTLQTRRIVLDVAATEERVGLAAGEYAVLTMSDTGSGMDRLTLQHLWEPFFSTKGELGTGLGLSIVYGIVQQNGGYVEVQSELGQGTVFRLYFPILLESGESKVVPEASAEPGARPAIVLLVEDEEMVRGLVRNVLQMSGYTVLEAQNGDEALRVAEAHPGPIHALLTDVVMPGRLSGRTLAEQLQAVRPETKVLFMSGYTDDALVRHGVTEEGLAFVQKPFTPTALMQKLRELLDDEIP